MTHKPMSVVWIVLCNLIIITSNSQRTNAAVPPKINDDGSIFWGIFDPIPKANLYTTFDDIKKPEVILDMSQGFVDFVIHGLPYETIRNTLIDLQDGSLDDIGDTTWGFIKGFIGLTILILIGILLFILVPFIGLIFCCCRCCGNCGGNRKQVDSNLGCKRVTFSIIFVALIGIVGTGMVFTNSANDFQRYTLDSSDEAFISISDATLNYTNDVLKQVKFMAKDQYNFADELIRSSLTDFQLSTDVIDYIQEDLKVEDLTDSLDVVLTDLQSLDTAFTNINNDRTELIAEEAELTVELAEIEDKLEIINQTCSFCILLQFNSQIQGHISQLPEITQDQIDSVNAGVVTVESILQEIDDSLHEIEDTINDETNETIYKAISELDNIQDLVDENFQKVDDAVNKTNHAVKDVQDGYKESLTSVEKWFLYRWFFFLGISCSILFIVILMILGFAMGTICYNNGSPVDRSCMSNTGGNCLMATVFFMFVLFPILILVTCVLFAGFGIATSTCTPLETLELYKETIDCPDVIMDGYFFGDLIYNNSTYEVTISGALEACRDDDTLYNAIKLEYLIDFEKLKEEFSEIEDTLDNFVGDIDGSDLDFSTIIPANVTDDLDNLLSDVGITEVDTDLYKALLPDSILTDPDYLDVYADKLIEIANSSAVDQTTKDELEAIATDLNNLQTRLVDPMTLSVLYINENITTVERINETLPVDVNKAQETSLDVENAVSSINETALAINLTEVYIKSLIGIGESYFEQTIYQIENEFAKCYNIWDIYQTTLKYTCGYLLNSGNALWFTIGWSVFFFLPSIIFSVKLAKHYRIMKEFRPPKQNKNHSNRSMEEEVVMNDRNGYHGNNDEGPIMDNGYRDTPDGPPPAYSYDNHKTNYTEFEDPNYQQVPRGEEYNPHARPVPAASIDMTLMNPVYDELF